MNYERERANLVRVLEAEGIRDPNVLDAIGVTRREAFVPETLRADAYLNTALPIGAEQTISQPSVVAMMTEALRLTGTEKVLEIGTGSGYQAAILSQLCREVVTIERIAELSRRAQVVLDALGYDNIDYHVVDGTLGYADAAPYDGIIVTAAAPKLPQTLLDQLTLGGRLVIPVGDATAQKLQLVIKRADGCKITDFCDVRFVPLIGAQGWSDSEGVK